MKLGNEGKQENTGCIPIEELAVITRHHRKPNYNDAHCLPCHFIQLPAISLFLLKKKSKIHKQFNFCQGRFSSLLVTCKRLTGRMSTDNFMLMAWNQHIMGAVALQTAHVLLHFSATLQQVLLVLADSIPSSSSDNFFHLNNGFHNQRTFQIAIFLRSTAFFFFFFLCPPLQGVFCGP